MFCKWCGATIRRESTQCPACGKETPPMSDCGGLYNLKYSQQHAQQRPVQPLPEYRPPVQPEYAYQPPVQPQQPQQPQQPLTQPAPSSSLPTVLLVVLLLVAVVSFVWALSLSGQVKDLKAQVAAMEAAATQTDPQNETGQTGDDQKKPGGFWPNSGGETPVETTAPEDTSVEDTLPGTAADQIEEAEGAAPGETQSDQTDPPGASAASEAGEE